MNHNSHNAGLCEPGKVTFLSHLCGGFREIPVGALSLLNMVALLDTGGYHSFLTQGLDRSRSREATFPCPGPSCSALLLWPIKRSTLHQNDICQGRKGSGQFVQYLQKSIRNSMGKFGKKATPQRKSKKQGYPLCTLDLEMLLHQACQYWIVKFVLVVYW
jgi:hypothetical protein